MFQPQQPVHLLLLLVLGVYTGESLDTGPTVCQNLFRVPLYPEESVHLLVLLLMLEWASNWYWVFIQLILQFQTMQIPFFASTHIFQRRHLIQIQKKLGLAVTVLLCNILASLQKKKLLKCKKS
ncbi:hypothetical protein TURU_015349 [Turdus rufiventris]|nr:hypothetical protein TURU_015349 [Turdus rufiventris]